MLAGVTSYSINETTAVEPWIISPNYAPEGSIVNVYDDHISIEPISLKQGTSLGKKYIAYSSLY